MVSSAESFLLDCLSRNAIRSADSFDELRYEQYHKYGSNLSLDKFPCTSETITRQIKWAYYQCHIWIGSATKTSSSVRPKDYGTKIKMASCSQILRSNDLFPRIFPILASVVNVRGKLCTIAVLYKLTVANSANTRTLSARIHIETF